MIEKPLCCVYTIPRDEAETRLKTIEIHSNAIPVHKSNTNFLNQKKDVVIQSMFQSYSWSQQKKRVNVFEKFNSYPNGVVKKKTCSRAFFKMIEMADYLPDFLSQNIPLRFLNIAEAPGGFIQGLNEIRKKYKTSKDWEIFDYYCGVTLEPEDDNPDWQKSLLPITKSTLMYADVMSEDAKQTIKDTSKENRERFHLITADCGIDVSSDFHKQEILMYPFLLAQTELMLRFIKPGGCFILKIFELDSFHTKELLYFIGCCFRQVIMVKPRSSRPLNSEKYIVCRNFKVCDPAEANRLADIMRLYKNRCDYKKGLLWKTSIPEDCLYLFHGYNRYCKEITNRHLQFIMKKIGDDVIRYQYQVAYSLSNEYNLETVQRQL